MGRCPILNRKTRTVDKDLWGQQTFHPCQRYSDDGGPRVQRRRRYVQIRPFELPSHFARIAGIDFGVGVGHPTAGAWLSWDRDVVYLYVCTARNRWTPFIMLKHSRKRTVVRYHGRTMATNFRPTKTMADGHAVKDKYRDHGLNMLGFPPL